MPEIATWWPLGTSIRSQKVVFSTCSKSGIPVFIICSYFELYLIEQSNEIF